MSSLDYLDLCRLCLVKDRVSVPIFEGEGNDLFLKIAACLPVKVAREDKLPKKICDDCVYKIELFYEFWNTTANAEKRLLQWLGEVSVEGGKQGYVSNVLNPNVMKQEQSTENRLDGGVMQQVGEHQNNMGMSMMDNMGLGIPMMMSNTNQQQQQITSVPMDTSGSSAQNVQAVPGPSSQATHNQISQNQTGSTQQEDEEESSEDEENSDDECDGDEGLPVKEESEEDPNSRTIEPTTFVNVSLACDEAGPSGLQQQKLTDMPEMSIPQPADGDPKTGEWVYAKDASTMDTSGRFIVKKGSTSMQFRRPNESIDGAHSSMSTSGGVVKFEEDQKIFLSSVKLEPNEGQHGGGWNLYTCDKCTMEFPMESMLNRHKISHNLISWLRKKGLSNGPASRSKSKKREKRVEPAKPSEKHKHACSFCDYGCSRRSTLTVHVRKKHKLPSPKEDTCKASDLCESQPNSRKRGKRSRNAKPRSLECNLCDFVCKTKRTLTSHMNRNHQVSELKETDSKRSGKAKSEDVPEACLEEYKGDDEEPIVAFAPVEVICEEEPTLVTIRPSKKESKKPVEEQCDLCDFKCAKKSTLYYHKRQHKAEDLNEIFSCNECAFKTTKKSSLYSHIKRKHRVKKPCTPDGLPELFYCNQCDHKNKSKYELKIHVARRHTDDFKFACEICGKKFKVKGDMTNHIRFSHKEQPVICDVCGKTCLNSNSLYVHQKFAHYKAKYECQVCKRRMVTQENLNEHMIRQHEKRESVVCEECGKTFTRNSRLKVHMRIHTGERPYTCTICSKSFARRTALKQHLLIHTGIRPYVCDICGKAFTQKPGLISHRKSHPGSHPPLPRVLIDHILHDVMKEH
ncbi:uncharacterized protein LOC143212765 isoform X2 [Lasioglossum baleicum]|uniref:uncharacterized protein LOC143212765 isoform X2 n=1 Tax=Lasioglossum baleicum TaxID=434251 RepID=UPI003FCED8BD